jgi:UDP-2,4-diacetamido-2,4,6-trideoxy-beta-L-altropyranose hydrolase
MPVEILQQLCGLTLDEGKKIMRIRRATYDDAMDVFDWRNDEQTRAMSKNSDIIDKDRHLAWFSAAISDPQRLILIGEFCQEKIGMVRFDYVDNGWDVSINVSPSMRGKGYGSSLLKEALRLLRNMGELGTVHAEVKTTNAPSVKVFEKCGFVICDKDNEYIYMSLIY